MANIRELPGKVGEFIDGKDHERRGLTYLALGIGVTILFPVIYAVPKEAQEAVAKALIAAPVALLFEGGRQLDMARRSRRIVTA